MINNDGIEAEKLEIAMRKSKLSCIGSSRSSFKSKSYIGGSASNCSSSIDELKAKGYYELPEKTTTKLIAEQRMSEE